MNDTSPPLRALVVLAGAAPAVVAASVCRLRRLGGLDALFIYHTAAWAPQAERLRRLAARQWPDVKTVVACEPGGDTPMALAARLRDWRRMRRDVTDWTYDLSGATPALPAAVSRVVCEEGGDVIAAAGNRAAGPWTRYRADTGGRLIPEAAFADAPSAEEADGADLPSFLEALAPQDAEVVWHGSRPPVRLAPAEIAAIAASGAANNWSWRESYRDALGRSAPLAWEFEDFVAATLAAIGVRNVRVHVGARIAGKPPREHVFDIVALHRGEVWTFDCHPGSDVSDQAAQPAALFGQRVAVLRPERRATPAERALSSETRRILDAEDCRALFDRLAEMMDVALPAAFDRVERRALTRQATARLPVFAPSSEARQFSEAMHLAQGVYDLPRGAAEDFGGDAPPWHAARVGGTLWALGGTLRKTVSPAEGRARLDAALQRARLGAGLVFFELAENKLDWCALVRARDRGAFARALAKWGNLPLFT